MAISANIAVITNKGTSGMEPVAANTTIAADIAALHIRRPVP
jgi:hypothetical protein